MGARSTVNVDLT